jgi:hypothetical protein
MGENEINQSALKSIADQMREDAKFNKRPWWLSWGIPVFILPLLCWLSTEVYGGIKEGLAEQARTLQVLIVENSKINLENSKINNAQNESLAVTAAVLIEMRADKQTSESDIELIRKDNWTAADDYQTRVDIYKRIDRNEIRIDGLEQIQYNALIDAEKIKTVIESLKK